MTILTWAETYICSAHKGDDGVMHGHTWRVRAHWDYAGACVDDFKLKLKAAVAPLDHALLPDALRRAEDLAAYLGDLVGARRVDVWRDAEGMGATWTL